MFAGVHVNRSANVQSIPSGVDTEMQFDTVIEDSGGFADLAGHDTYVQVPPGGAGVYLVYGNYSSFPGTGSMKVAVGRVISGGTEVIARNVQNAADGVDGCEAGPVLARLVAGDQIKLIVYQESGGAVDTDDLAPFSNSLQLTYIGP